MFYFFIVILGINYTKVILITNSYRIFYPPIFVRSKYKLYEDLAYLYGVGFPTTPRYSFISLRTIYFIILNF